MRKPLPRSRYSSNLASSPSVLFDSPSRITGSRASEKVGASSAANAGTLTARRHARPSLSVPTPLNRNGVLMAFLSLVTQLRARGMVAAMDRGVAVEAAAVEHAVARPRAVGDRGAVVHGAGVTGLRMALLAEHRHAGLLELRVVGTVRRMA